MKLRLFNWHKLLNEKQGHTAKWNCRINANFSQTSNFLKAEMLHNSFPECLSFILWIKIFWCQNLTHQFPHLSLETAVTGVDMAHPWRPAEWHHHWYLSRCSGTCKTNPAWSMVAHHHCLTRGHLPGSSCHLSRALLCRPAVQEPHLSYQPLITRCVWSLLGACTENMFCAKGLARSLSGAQLSMRLPGQLQQRVNGFCLVCHYSTQIPTTYRMICKSWPSFLSLLLGFIRLFLGLDWNHNKSSDFERGFWLVGFLLKITSWC